MSMKYIFYGNVKNGRLQLMDKVKFDFVLSKLGGMVELAISRVTKQRSLAQNRYYWGVIVKAVSDEMGVIPDVAHGIMASIWLKIGTEYKGRRYEFARSTTTLSTKDFKEYCENCRMWAAEELNINIPAEGELDLDY
jgi:hypothetical protein